MGTKPRTYWGSGADGVFNSTGNVTWSVPGHDAYAVVKQFTRFTLNAGHSLQVSHRNRGIIIYATERITIAGTINQNQKAALASLTDTLPHIFPVAVDRLLWPGQSLGASEKSLFIPALLGGAGGAGGSGGSSYSIYQDNERVGRGGRGGSGGPPTWFGGGMGGGGGGGGYSYAPDRYEGESRNGGNGGDGSTTTVGTGGKSRGASGGPGAGGAGSGSGNYGYGGDGPGGGGGGAYGGDGSAGLAWGGGLVVLIAPTIEITSTGAIYCNGGPGGAGGYLSGPGGGGGGGGGGGVILIIYRDSYINNGTLQVNGGAGGSGSPSGTLRPGLAGNSGQVGTIRVVKVS